MTFQNGLCASNYLVKKCWIVILQWDDIHFAIKKYSLKMLFNCVFSDLNANNLIFRIRLANAKSLMSSKKKNLDQTDEIYHTNKFTK